MVGTVQEMVIAGNDSYPSPDKSNTKPDKRLAPWLQKKSAAPTSHARIHRPLYHTTRRGWSANKGPQSALACGRAGRDPPPPPSTYLPSSSHSTGRVDRVGAGVSVLLGPLSARCTVRTYPGGCGRNPTPVPGSRHVQPPCVWHPRRPTDVTEQLPARMLMRPR